MMSYYEYKNSGRCPGKCLYQLSQLGIPNHIVSSVIFNRDGQISYNGNKFASYEYNSDDTPIFKFFAPYDHLFRGLTQKGNEVAEDLFAKVALLKTKFR